MKRRKIIFGIEMDNITKCSNIDGTYHQHDGDM